MMRCHDLVTNNPDSQSKLSVTRTVLLSGYTKAPGDGATLQMENYKKKTFDYNVLHHAAG